MIWMQPSPKCHECGELNTADDCVCCRDCDTHPCECVCDDCGELIEDTAHRDVCECDG